MLRLAKILSGLVVVIVLGLATVVMGFVLLDEHQWNEASANSFIEIIGKWGGESFEKVNVIETRLLPMGTSRESWIDIMEGNDFGVIQEDEKCSWAGSNKLEFLEEYESCAAKIVGDTGCCSCNYVYIVAAKFGKDGLQELVGTHSHFMCM